MPKVHKDPNWVRAVAPGAALGVLFIVITYLAKIIPDNFYGEDFALFYYSASESFSEAISSFFQVYGRLFEAVYWSATYQLVGYQPAIHHIFSLLLSLVGASLAALVIYRAWPQIIRSKWALAAFLALIFFSPFTLGWAGVISGDNSRLAICFYLISILLLQEWVASRGALIWLFAGFATFVIAVLTYENVSFLFPAGMLLALTQLKSGPQRKPIIKWAIGLSAVSFLVILLPFLIYSQMGIGSHPAFYGDGILVGLAERAIAAIYYTGYFFTISGAGIYSLPAAWQVAPLIVLAITLGCAIFVLTSTTKNKKKHPATLDSDRNQMRLIFAAALWLLLFGVLTYAIAYPGLGSRYARYFTVATYGFAILWLLVATAKQRALQVIAIGVLAIAVVFGIREFSETAIFTREGEPLSLVQDYLSLTEVVPAVLPGTTFYFVDNGFWPDPWRSCAVSLHMLYETTDLRCIYLTSTDEGLRATRTETDLISPQGGTIRNDYTIIVGEDETGKKVIIPQIDPSSDLLIDWSSERPLRTNYSRILPATELTGMVQKLQERERLLLQPAQ